MRLFVLLAAICTFSQGARSPKTANAGCQAAGYLPGPQSCRRDILRMPCRQFVPLQCHERVIISTCPINTRQRF
jgi:hypothetical protein